MGNMLFMKYMLVLVYLLHSATAKPKRPPVCAEPVTIRGDDCKCFETKPTIKELWCRNISCFTEFTSYLRQMQGYNVTKLVMGNIDVKYISKVVFDGDFKGIEIFFSVFENRLFEEIPEDNNITYLQLTKVKIADGKWDWQYISPLKLENLVITAMPLGGLQNFTHFKETLTHLALYACDLKKLRDDQFREYTKLQMIDIRYDSLEDLKNSMFPPQIRVVSFRHNRLTSLREDLFVGMEHLDVVDFEYNRLTVLSENFFRPIWNSVVFLLNNPLKCDCSMKWVMETKMVNGLCASPDHLKGKDIKHLTEEDFKMLCA